MKKSLSNSLLDPLKARTGIEGFDAVTCGGLPRGRTTLLEGGAGSGKTILSLQSLVNGARHFTEPGIFVAFEESPQRIKANARKFGWNLEALEKKCLVFFDAQPTLDLVQSGSFDISGLLAMLEAKVKEMKAQRIVFDALDIILSLFNDPKARRMEAYRLHEWLLKHGLTAIITAKAYEAESKAEEVLRLGFLQFMVDCSVTLNHKVVQGVSQRNLRVMKYRGSTFSENESPLLIGDGGIEVAGCCGAHLMPMLSIEERVSSGVGRLDAMLGGGYYRNASILITGVPGTAKSTLAGAFVVAACQRGERAAYVSFDSNVNEMLRNLASVNIRLQRHIKNGLLKMVWERSITGSAEIHLMQIKKMAESHGARYVIIDPVSALSKMGNEFTSSSVAERLFDWTKGAGITLLCTSLLEDSISQVESTPLQISTMSDTWIHLNYAVRSGERNRGLSIVKSRGTQHSNQVRELILSKKGVTLADVYSAGGEVLMGTLRWEKEREQRAALEQAKSKVTQRQAHLKAEEAQLEAKLMALQCELATKRTERKALSNIAENHSQELSDGENKIRKLRGIDKV